MDSVNTGSLGGCLQESSHGCMVAVVSSQWGYRSEQIGELVLGWRRLRLKRCLSQGHRALTIPLRDRPFQPCQNRILQIRVSIFSRLGLCDSSDQYKDMVCSSTYALFIWLRPSYTYHPPDRSSAGSVSQDLRRSILGGEVCGSSLRLSFPAGGSRQWLPIGIAKMTRPRASKRADAGPMV